MTHRIALILLATALPLAAQAADRPADTRMVRVTDAELHTPAGMARVHHAIAVAARRVCGPVEMVGSNDFASYQSCLAGAEAKAQRQLDQVTARLDTTRLAMR